MLMVDQLARKNKKMCNGKIISLIPLLASIFAQHSPNLQGYWFEACTLARAIIKKALILALFSFYI